MPVTTSKTRTITPDQWVSNEVDRLEEQIRQTQEICEHDWVKTGQRVITHWNRGQNKFDPPYVGQVGEWLENPIAHPLLLKCTLCSQTRKVNETEECGDCLIGLVKISGPYASGAGAYRECPNCGYRYNRF